MINEYTYIIGMNFILWVVAIFMLFGYSFLKFCEADAKDEYISDEKRIPAQTFVQQFYSKDFAGKVVELLKVGALASSFMFMGLVNSFKKIVKNTNKKENKK